MSTGLTFAVRMYAQEWRETKKTATLFNHLVQARHEESTSGKGTVDVQLKKLWSEIDAKLVCIEKLLAEKLSSASAPPRLVSRYSRIGFPSPRIYPAQQVADVGEPGSP